MDDTSVPAGAEPHGTRIELRFRMELADYVAMMKQVRWTALERTYAVLSDVPAGIVGAMLGAFVWRMIESSFPSISDFDGVVYSVALSGAATYVLLRFVVWPAYMRSYLRGHPIGMGETILIGDADGMTATSVGVTTSFDWASLVAVRDTKDHVILWYSRLAGVTIPKRAFGSSEQLERFMALVRCRAPSSTI